MKDQIARWATAVLPEVIRLRRHFHQYPELSFEERATSAFIKNYLDQLGIAWYPMARNGIVATLKGGIASQKTIALRADMDALPIQEANDLPYRSVHAGVMHACGHDMHMASLLGVAIILKEQREQLAGNVRFIFQPAEEKLPGGAQQMVKEGVLENPRPMVVIGQHVMPELAVGKVGFRAGNYMASNDELYITVKGKGGHAAQPHQNIDPVVISAQLIINLQSLVSRMADPRIPTVLSFGRVVADGAVNIIPNEVHLSGTLRTLDAKWRTACHERIRNLAKSTAAAMGGTCTVDIVQGYPVLHNDPSLTASLEAGAVDFLGRENVIPLDVWMAAEDFAYYAEQVPSCFYRIGVNSRSALHTPTFLPNEEALGTSVGLMVYLVCQHLMKAT